MKNILADQTETKSKGMQILKLFWLRWPVYERKNFLCMFAMSQRLLPISQKNIPGVSIKKISFDEKNREKIRKIIFIIIDNKSDDIIDYLSSKLKLIKHCNVITYDFLEQKRK